MSTGMDPLEKIKLQKEIEKLDLEKEKIIQETKELKKVWIRKSQWWVIILPVLLSLVPYYILKSSGFFNASKLNLETSNLKLQMDNVILQHKKDSLTLIAKRIDSLILLRNDSVHTLRDSINIIAQQKSDLQVQYDAISKNVGNVSKQLQYVNEKRIHDRDSLNKIIDQNQRKCADRIQIIQTNDAAMHEANMQMGSDLRYYRSEYSRLHNEADSLRNIITKK